MIPAEPKVLKSCCATAYANPLASLLLGESWHPGGLILTEELGRQLALSPTDLVLDVASGQGASARMLAERFHCRVVGIDYGVEQVAQARRETKRRGIQEVSFVEGDAECLPWENASADAVVCECALCTFPTPQAAVQEWARVLMPGGRVGLTDMTRRGPLPLAFDSLAGWIGCIAGAQPLEGYAELLRDAGFLVRTLEDHSEALMALVNRIGRALVSWLQFQGPLARVGDWSQEDVEHQLGEIRQAINAGRIGYGLITAWKTV